MTSLRKALASAVLTAAVTGLALSPAFARHHKHRMHHGMTTGLSSSSKANAGMGNASGQPAGSSQGTVGTGAAGSPGSNAGTGAGSSGSR